MSTKKSQQAINHTVNAIESLSNKMPNAGEVVASAVNPLVSEAQKITEEFVAGLFGVTKSVEIYPGQSIEIDSKKTENSTVVFNREVVLGEASQIEKQRLSELRQELQIIANQVDKISEVLDETNQELEIAILQTRNVNEVSEYKIGVLTKLLESLVSFRKKIEKAKIWLQSANLRNAKKGWLANYKQHGAKYLLSGEHYISRSAG